MFKPVVLLKKIGDFEKFIDAHDAFMKAIQEKVDDGVITRPILETACFIIYESGDALIPLGFLDVHEYAHEIGLCDASGHLQVAAEPPIERVVASLERIIASNAEIARVETMIEEFIHTQMGRDEEGDFGSSDPSPEIAH